MFLCCSMTLAGVRILLVSFSCVLARLFTECHEAASKQTERYVGNINNDFITASITSSSGESLMLIGDT